MKFFITLLSAGLLMSQTMSAKVIFDKVYGESTCYNDAFDILALDNNQFLVSGADFCPHSNTERQTNQFVIDNEGEILHHFQNSDINGLVRKTPDNHLIYAGGNSAGLNYDTVVITKTDLVGQEIWTTPIYFNSCLNNVWDVQVLDNNQIIVAGTYTFTGCTNPLYDSYVSLLDENGNILWNYRHEGPLNDQLYSIRQTPDGGFVAAGWTSSVSGGLNEKLLIKIDANGSEEWVRTFSGDNNHYYAYGLTITPDGSIISIGYTDKIKVMKTDAYGISIWENTYGEACGGIYFQTLLTKDGGLAFLANKNTGNGCRSVLFKTSKDGDLYWEKAWDARLRSVIEKNDGSFMLAGSKDHLPNAYVVHFDSLKFLSTYTSDDLNDKNLSDKNLQNENNDNTFTHIDESNLSNAAYYENKLDEEVISNVEMENAENNSFQISLYPIPAESYLQVEFNKNIATSLSVYNFQGQRIFEHDIRNVSEFTINRNSLPAGQYLLIIKDNKNRLHTERFIFR
ncbi:MAG: T9SS C-terminal target domain-containing protein [Chitinophagaceae bacterium]|nr:MAG: T9SS C-terminal target domain-containing protein [Chitinophagaceae bacterium]